jgi:UDP-2,3-diacylglucosamine hydrolase
MENNSIKSLPTTWNKQLDHPVWVVSDAHLGVDAKLSSLEREKHLVRWLDLASQQAQTLVLLGDIFDFWFEWKHAIPKGYSRLFGKLAELKDQGIDLHFFPGNHDMWTFGYLEKEFGMAIHRTPEVWKIQGLPVYLGHGDGLGPGDYSYKALKKVFAHPLFQWLYARFHPNFSFGLASMLSQRSRKSGGDQSQFLGEEKEWLIQFSKSKSKHFPEHLFLFGHRHLPMHHALPNGAHYLNTGDWLQYFSYVRIEQGHAELWFWPADGQAHMKLRVP